MSAPDQHHALTPGRERATLLTLGAVQFTHVLDFMIMMPLGAQLMDVFHITPAQFTHLVAAYGLSAAIFGFAGGFVLDRFDRKRSLLVLYAGFGLATFACGLAPTHHWLLAARFAAGAFGGLAGSMVVAMVGDIVPPERRGRAMSFVMTSFAVASVLGVPAGIFLASKSGWHAPFFMLGGLAGVNLILGAIALPHIRTAVHGHEPWRQMREILSHRVHLRAFAVGAVLVMAGGSLIPFVAPSMVANAGLTQFQLLYAYGAGGLCSIVSMPIIGRLSDRVDKLKLLAWMSACAVIVVLIRHHGMHGDGGVHGHDVEPFHARDGHGHQCRRRALPRRLHERQRRRPAGCQRPRQCPRRRLRHPGRHRPPRRLPDARLGRDRVFHPDGAARRRVARRRSTRLRARCKENR
jgi:predicted MFS family arabinose efflux permease